MSHQPGISSSISWIIGSVMFWIREEPVPPELTHQYRRGCIAGSAEGASPVPRGASKKKKERGSDQQKHAEVDQMKFGQVMRRLVVSLI